MKKTIIIICSIFLLSSCALKKEIDFKPFDDTSRDATELAENVGADSKVTELTELATVADDADIFYVIDDPSGTPTSKKITRANILGATLTDIADGTIAENLVNTANPWADNEVADDITCSNYMPISGGAFTGFPTTPSEAPDADYEVANKKYVDDNAGGFDPTAVDSVTWSDGSNASNVWTFDLSGTDITMTANSGSMDFSLGLSAGAEGFDVDADGDVIAKSVTVSKISGVAGLNAVYEANSTDTGYIGMMGPASITESFSHQYSSTQPSGSVYVWGTPAGTGDPNGEKVSACTLYQITDLQFQSLAVADLNDTATPSVLETEETINKCISNYKSSGADHVFTLPAAHTKGNVIFMVGDEFQVDIEPDSGENFYLNGTAMAADEHIQNTADTLGERIVGYCANINGSLTWMFYSSDTNWVEESP